MEATHGKDFNSPTQGNFLPGIDQHKSPRIKESQKEGTILRGADIWTDGLQDDDWF